VALAMQRVGLDVVLVEPGSGARNGLKRGLMQVVRAALGDAEFIPHSLPAAGAFDVVEHIQDDAGFLNSVHALLIPGGRLYCTVPAHPLLWSDEDASAGHYRRYTSASLAAVMQRAGFKVEFLSYFFAWLFPPILLLRSAPYRLGLRRCRTKTAPTLAHANHRVPSCLSGLVHRFHEWELKRLRCRKGLPFGSSLLCVAQKSPL